MAVRVHVANDRQRICPVRLTRAITGPSVIDAPEIDDRGWQMPRPGGWNATDALGPMFGMTKGDTIRLKVVREDLDAGCNLYATVSPDAPPQIEIAEPAGGGPIPADGIFKVKALEANSTGSKLQIRLGSATGPVVAEAEPHVFNLLTIRIKPHICTIHQAATAGAGTGTTPVLRLAQWFDYVKAIWRTAGITFRLDATDNLTYTGFAVDDMPRWSANGPGREFDLMNQGHMRNRLNIWFTRYMHRSAGVAHRPESLGGMPNPGIIVGVSGEDHSYNFGPPHTGGAASAASPVNHATAHDHYLGKLISHEIGHYLTLKHAGNVNSPGRLDTYTRRMLMFPTLNYPAGRNNDVGYGNLRSGVMVTMKRFSFFNNDGQCSRARTRAAANNATKYGP